MDERILKSLGNEWERNGMHRVYFNDLAAWYGLEASYYNTGNVMSATLAGRKISNTEAREILGALGAGKLFYDFADHQFHGRGIGQGQLNTIVAAIRAKVDAAAATTEAARAS